MGPVLKFQIFSFLMAMTSAISAETSTQSYTADNARYASATYGTPAATAASYSQPVYSDTYSSYYGQYAPISGYGSGYRAAYNTQGNYGYGYESYGDYRPAFKAPFLKKVPLVKVYHRPCKSVFRKAIDWFKPCKKPHKCRYEPYGRYYGGCYGNYDYNLAQYDSYGWSPTIGPYGGPVYDDLGPLPEPVAPFYDPLISNQYPFLAPQPPLLG